MPGTRRTGHADAVLSALGYQSERPRAPRDARRWLAGSVAIAAALVVWAYWPGFHRKPAAASAGKAPQTQAPPSPAAMTPVTTTAPAPPASAGGPPAEQLKTGGSGDGRGAKSAPPATKIAEPSVSASGDAATKALSSPPAARGTIPAADRHAIAAPGESLPSTTRRPAGRAAVLPPAERPKSPAVPAADDFQLALYYQRAGDFEQALLHYRNVLQRDQLNIEAHNNVGILYQGKGLYEDAAREFQRVLAIDQGYLTAHLNLSAAYLKLGRFEASAAEARAALALDPRNSGAMVNLALAQQGAGRPAEADASLRRAIALDPQNAAAHYNLARQYDRIGEVGLALDHYRQFLQYAGPDQATYAPDVRDRVQALEVRIK